jgi:Bacterial pre-peptidase C-terminal domain
MMKGHIFEMRLLAHVLALALLITVAVAPAAMPAAHGEDCHGDFAYYLAAKPYIINPAASDRAETTIVAMIDRGATDLWGAVPYRIEVIASATGRVVWSAESGTNLSNEPRELLVRWDGSDMSGAAVPDGEYRIRVIAQLYAGETWRPSMRLLPTLDDRGGEVPGSGGTVFAARGSEVRVVVDRQGVYNHLFARPTVPHEGTARAAIDTTFPYNFFFGSTHAHTSWSDGGMPTTDCASGRYGYVGGATPTDAFNYAKSSGQLDYLAVVEHNHLMMEACSGCTNAQVLSRYQAGVTAAQSATVAGSFVGLFGMEWGVISSGGHINIYNQNKLISWDAEPYDVYVPKSNYAQLYTALRNNQGTLGSYGSFCHPNSTDYNSFARTADGDAVVRGTAIISGPAFNTSTSFSPGGSTYVGLYNLALEYGWKIAPEAHQDNHCWNYGNSTPNRTVAVIPTTQTFNQQTLMQAYNARHFYAQQDLNAQLVYRTQDSSHIMGDAFGASAGVPVYVGVSDANGEGVQKIEIWGGKAGTPSAPGAAPTVVASNTGASTLSATLSPAVSGQEWYYYVIATQADGDNLWSAPLWITWGGSCTAPSTPALSSPAAGATGVATSTSLSWSAASGATSYDVYFGTASTPAFYQNTTATSLAVSGLANSTTYYWTAVAKSSCGSSSPAATRSFTTAASTGGTTTPISCGQSLSGSLATTDPYSTIRTTSYADTYTFSGTAGTAVTITLSSTAFDAWLVLKDPNGTVVAQDDDGNGGTNSKIAYTPAVSGTFKIEATSYSASVTGAYTIALSCTTPPTTVTLIDEGAESGATGWSMTTNTGSGWSIQSSTDSYAGSYRFRTNAAYTTYVNSANWVLTSPAFSLSGKTAATLKYAYKFSTESAYDFFIVEISKDGGTTWTQLSKSSGKSSGYSVWAPLASVSLNTYVGSSSCKIRFRLTSDGSVTDWGAAVDSVQVTAQ